MKLFKNERRRSGDFWSLASIERTLLIALLLTSHTTIANETPKSIDLNESAWRAKLKPQEIGARVAERIITRKDNAPDYSGLELASLLALFDTTANDNYARFVEETVREGTSVYGKKAQRYESQIFTSTTFELLRRGKATEYVGSFLCESKRYREEVLRAYDGAISYYKPEMAVVYLDSPTNTLHLQRRMEPILIDQLQEYASRMAQTGWLSGDKQYYSEAVAQFQIFHETLRDSKSGLWSHGRGWYGKPSSITEIKWGRGQAWILRGLVETLSYLPPGSQDAHRISTMLDELATALLKYQDADGFWHQVVDRPESYQETSSTGLISYYFSRAVRQGFLPSVPYADSAGKAFIALSKHKISAEGVVYGGSASAPPLQSLDDYLNWNTPIDDPHAVAAVIFAAAGQLLLQGHGAIPMAVGQHGFTCNNNSH